MSVVVPRSPAQPRIQLNITIEPALKARIARLAAKRGCFESRLVREALVEYLDTAEQRGCP